MLTNRAKEVFEKDKFAVGLTGAEIVHAAPGESVCSLAIGPQHMNAAGVVMGGVIFTLADLAFAVAANTEATLSDPWDKLWMSLDADIHFLRPAQGSRLTAKARCIKNGRTTCLYSIDIIDEQERLVATIQSTGIKTI